MKKLILFLLPLTFVACSDDNGVDITPPNMQILSLVPNPAAGEICGTMEDTVFSIRGGETLLAELAFSDNDALSQYKVDIHNNFDCHGHGGTAAPGVPVPSVGSVTEDWTVLTLEDLSGTSESITLSIKAPDNVTAGSYHFQIQVLDESGNDNPLANFYSIRAYHPADEEAPVLSVQEPAENELTAAKGSTLTFSGQVTDNYSLSDGGNGLVFLSYTDLSSGNTFSTDAFISFDDSVGTDYDFELNFVVPQTIQAGDYRVRIDAHDGVRNVAEPVFFELQVTN
jgi:hypothetical protein